MSSRDDPGGSAGIGDYAFLSDCHTAALVSDRGSVDWLCAPRFDSASVFARLLDEVGGSCSLRARRQTGFARRYLPGTLVLEHRLTTETGVATVTFALATRHQPEPGPTLLAVVDGQDGIVELAFELEPRFDYGIVRAWFDEGPGGLVAIGSHQGLRVVTDSTVEHERTRASAEVAVRAGDRRRIAVVLDRPERLIARADRIASAELDRALDETVRWWQRWSARSVEVEDEIGIEGVARSAVVLKGLQYAPTGAVVAAATTSLPEGPGRTWDYRYAWIRDASWTARTLGEIGYDEIATEFRGFIERSAAGSAAQLQVLYGIGGEIRLPELEIGGLGGYHGAGPVRVGNSASRQRQLDRFGELLDLAWRASQFGHAPDRAYWNLLRGVVDDVRDQWSCPDAGIWEERAREQHFVHSKVMCWVAVDRALRIALEQGFEAPLDEWRALADEIRVEIEQSGVGSDGSFRRSFGEDEPDGALLRIPMTGFLPWSDARVVRTTERIRAQLTVDGHVRRTRDGSEGTFVPCTFWLAEALANQGRSEEARQTYDRGTEAANDLGLFAEEYDPTRAVLRGNFPQGLSHLSHLAATFAIAEHPEYEPRVPQDG